MKDCTQTLLAEMGAFLSDHADREYPKGKSEDRGAAITHIAFFLADYGKRVKEQNHD